MRHLFALMVALSAAVAGETVSKNFPSQAIKQMGGSSVHITSSIDWEGEKRTQNASAYMHITEYVASGKTI
jgi:hypothetical protein